MKESLKTTSGRRFVPLFYLGLTVGTLVLCWAALRNPQVQKLRAGEYYPKTRCAGIIDGRTILISEGDAEREVKLLGVLLPSEANPDSDSSAADETAKRTLTAWIYKKPVKIISQHPDTASEAYVEVFAVDIGRKLLQGGQLTASREPHPLLEEYRACEEEAREAHLGIWRNQ
ncbi:MAG: hypothetical protein KJ626_00490 [Verrucomicrobia bacterium]|nr:hypothetical protein [Verrucomicrobiota bacterium]